MIIGIQKGLTKVKEYLLNRGFEVEENLSNVDIFIYDSVDYNGFYNLVDTNSNEGTMLINSHNKSMDEVENIIIQKRYSKLF